MAEVLFYHLTESRIEDALPPLLEKTLERGWRAVVQCGGEERLNALNEHLWTYRDDSFLPHGLAGDGNEAAQPVFLALDDANPNGATVRFHVDGAMPGDITRYARAVLMFDGHDNGQLDDARASWKRLKGEGHAVSYWQQAQGGRWEKKA